MGEGMSKLDGGGAENFHGKSAHFLLVPKGEGKGRGGKSIQVPLMAFQLSFRHQ
jgi:hypothetical protein